jgi:hypothetical protein
MLEDSIGHLLPMLQRDTWSIPGAISVLLLYNKLSIEQNAGGIKI